MDKLNARDNPFTDVCSRYLVPTRRKERKLKTEHAGAKARDFCIRKCKWTHIFPFRLRDDTPIKNDKITAELVD